MRKDFLRRLHPIHLGHHQVQEDYVRSKAGGQLHRLEAIGPLPNHFHIILHFDEHAQPLAHHRMVVHQ